MKKLSYYGFYYSPSESDKGQKYEELNTGKLYSKYSNDQDNPQNLGKILYSPPNSEGYSSNMKLPSEQIIFYNFSARNITLRLDDVMSSPEINTHIGFFVSPRLKEILDEYNLSDHRYYPVNIHFQNKVHPYYFLLISYRNNGVNYQKSTFIDAYDETKNIDIKTYVSPH